MRTRLGSKTALHIFATLFLFGTLSGPGLRGCLAELPDLRPRVEKDSPVYLQAAAIFRDSPIVLAHLGGLAHEEIVEGRQEEPDSLEAEAPYAFFTVAVSGPKGAGKIHAVGNLVSGEWRLSAVSMAPEGSPQRINLLPPPPREKMPLRAGQGTVYLVPLGEPVSYTLAGIPEYFEQRFGVKMEVLPPIPLNASAEHPKEEGTVIAEKLVNLMADAYPELRDDPTAILIGITERRMAVITFAWSSSTTFRRQGRFAVISTERIQPWKRSERENPEILQVRLRKLLLKDVGLLYYKLPLSGDPGSVLVAYVDSGSTLDLMTEEFLGVTGSWQPYLFRTAPCVYITRFPQGQSHWSLGACGRAPPRDTGYHQFLFYAGNGLFVQQHHDFLLPEPFALTRMYRPQDNFARAFGLGANHSLDVFLAGSSDTAMYLILEDGARIHFQRPWVALPFLHPVYKSDPGTDSPFAGASLQWTGDGWELERRDGWNLVFPGAQPTRYQQAAPIRITHADGRAFDLVRDGRGNLRRVLTPTGESLRLDYDPYERIRRITHSGGRWADYSYDAKSRLNRVQVLGGDSAVYSYDSENRMTAVELPAGRVFLRNKYDKEGWLEEQDFADGRSFKYSRVGPVGQPTEVAITDSDGFVTRVLRVSGGYVVLFPQPPETTRATP